MFASKTILALCVAALLSACGGGDAPPAAQTPPVNSPPVANAGVAQSVVTGTLVTLDGSASSDANSDPLSYMWALTSKPNGSVATLSTLTSPRPTITTDMPGTYIASLVVNDGTVNSNASTASIAAAEANAAPVANAGVAQNVVTGALVTLDGSASSDANGDPLTYAWTLTTKPAGSAASLSSVTSAKPTFTADVAGTYVASLVVNDGTIGSVATSVSIAASVANAKPVANAGSAQNVAAGTTVTLDGSASSDANSDPLTYLWTLTSRPAGSAAILSTSSSPNPTFKTDLPGTYVASLVVNDGKIDSNVATVNINATAANVAPVANAGPGQNVLTGTVVSLDGRASSDANGDTLTYAWTLKSKPAGSTASLSSVTSSTPTFTADVAGTYVASLVVNDGTIGSTASSVSIAATVANAAPVANAGKSQNVAAGELVTLDGSASSDANNDPLTYVWTLTSKPAGSRATLSSATSPKASFTADLAGIYIAKLIVSDGKLTSDAASVSIRATVLNLAPIANAGATQRKLVNLPITLDGSASTDPEGASLTYAWTLAVPAGSTAKLGSATAMKPAFVTDVAGIYTATLTVNDGKASSAVATTTVGAFTELAGALGISPNENFDFCSINGTITTSTSAGTGKWTVRQCSVAGTAGSPLWARFQNNRRTPVTVSQIVIISGSSTLSLNVGQTINAGATADFAIPLSAGMSVTNASAYFTLPKEPALVVKLTGSMALP